ncbi:MAG TPA: biopolymer transporter ExbD [Candidatus Limnocylindria bacterium]|jgi:biopolymer transport protein ExbD|nr:biopolymer transporter ExbD [Candidatus Limnocylindria bacterium]
MRRFSQRNQLVTLSEINITPLLDLAFVLLIIFIITTPLLEQSLNLRLPVANGQNSSSQPDDVVTVEAVTAGGYRFKGRPVANEEELGRKLAQAFGENTNLMVRIRVDKDAPAQRLVSILDVCGKEKISRFRIATDRSSR